MEAIRELVYLYWDIGRHGESTNIFSFAASLHDVLSSCDFRCQDKFNI